jgi:hypothetical protein
VLRVPAGTFSAFRVDYKIEKPNRTERYRLFVTKELPHMMLREDFQNGVISELVTRLSSLEPVPPPDLKPLHTDHLDPHTLLAFPPNIRTGPVVRAQGSDSIALLNGFRSSIPL